MYSLAQTEEEVNLVPFNKHFRNEKLKKSTKLSLDLACSMNIFLFPCMRDVTEVAILRWFLYALLN